MQDTTERVNTNISRRKLLQTAAGAVATASIASLVVTKPISAAPAPTGVDDDTIFPILAAWLVISTSDAFVSMSPSTISTQTGIPAPAVQTAINQVTANSALYNQIRKEFKTLRTNLSYGGPQCPNAVGTLKPVSQCHLGPAPAKPSKP